MKEKFSWEKFKGNGRMAVWCKTEEECKEFCKKMSEHEMKWSDGNSYKYHKAKNNCFCNEIEDCTMCYANNGRGGSIDSYEELKYMIYTLQDVLESEKCDIKFGSLFTDNERKIADAFISIGYNYIAKDKNRCSYFYKDNNIGKIDETGEWIPLSKTNSYIKYGIVDVFQNVYWTDDEPFDLRLVK